jgi:hypothetical protein
MAIKIPQITISRWDLSADVGPYRRQTPDAADWMPRKWQRTAARQGSSGANPYRDQGIFIVIKGTFYPD